MKTPKKSPAKSVFRSRTIIATAIIAGLLSSFALASAQASGAPIVETIRQMLSRQTENISNFAAFISPSPAAPANDITVSENGTIQSAVSSPLAGGVIVVNPGGGGNFTTIQAAINNASPGDTIAIKTGTYTENLNLSLMGSAIGGTTGNIQLVAVDGPSTAVLNGSGVKISQSGAFNGSLIIDGLRFSTTNEDGIRLSTPTNLLVVNSTFDSIGSDNAAHDGLELSLSIGSHQVVLYNNTFRNIANDAIVLSATGTNTQVTYTIVGNSITDDGTNANTTDQGIKFEARNNAVVNAIVTSNSLTQLESNGVVFSAGETAKLNGYVTRNTIGPLNTSDNGITVETLNSATTAIVDATIADNTISNVSSGIGILINLSGTTSTVSTPSITARIVRNTLTAIGANEFDRGITILGLNNTNVQGTITALVANNQLNGSAASGLGVVAGGSLNIDATIRNNTFLDTAQSTTGTNEAGMVLASTSLAARLRTSLTGNTTTTSSSSYPKIRLLQNSGTFQLEGNTALSAQQNVAADNPASADSVTVGGTIGIIAPGTLTAPAENTTPNAVDDTANAVAGTPTTINVMANDTDAQGAVGLNFFSFSSFRGGTVTRNDNGTPSVLTDDKLVYTAPSGFSGSDSFYYTVADGGQASDVAKVTVTVTATPPNLSINDVSLNEGNSGTTSFTFTVSLSAPAPAGGVTFNIATADGTAVQPGDYTTKSLTSQTIPAGSSTYSFTVLVNGDTTPETNETFFVNVTNVTGANVTDAQGQGTIVNDDVAPNLTINDVSLNEGNAGTTTFTFTVSLSAPAPAGGVTFDIATANGTATSPSDYTAKTLTGQTISAGNSTYSFTVLVNGDTTPEANETFFVNVTNVTGATVTDGQGQGTITNDDVANPSAGLLMYVNSSSSNVPGFNENFSYDLLPSNNGNAPLDNLTVIDTLPDAFQVLNVTTGAYSNLSDFAAGEGVRVSYEKNTAPGVFTLWGSSPNVATNTTLTAPPPGLGAGEYITKIRWQYGQAAAGMIPTTRPRVSGRIINPSNSGNTVNNGNSIQNCASLSAVYTAGPTNVTRNACRTFAVGVTSQTLVVDNTSDDETLANCTNGANDCSLRGAISAAFSGDTISFSTLFDTAQTININDQLVINKNLTINGKGANLLTVRNIAAASATNRVFLINSGTVNLNGLTITGGRVSPPVGNNTQQGGGIFNSGTLTITNSTVIDNSVTGDNSSNHGGGIFSSGALTITNSTFSGNFITGGDSAANAGGGIYYGGALTITNSTVAGNSVTGSNVINIGGGIYISSGTTNARNTIISGNSAATDADVSGNLTVNENNLIGSNARLLPLGNYGGATPTHALYPDSPAINAGNDCVLDSSCTGFNAPSNLTTDQRGQARKVGSKVDIGAFEAPASLIVTNTNNDGTGSLRAAIMAANTNTDYDAITFDIPATDTGCASGVCTITLTSGELGVNGAALIYNAANANRLLISGNNQSRVFNVASSANVTLNGVTVTNGRDTGFGGGGIRSDNGANLNIINSTISDNSAPFSSGGGILSFSSNVTITNSTISGNSASSSVSGNGGGGIGLNSSNATITNSTIYNNSTQFRGGGIRADFSTLNLRNTIVAGNTAEAGQLDIFNNSSNINSNGKNLIGDSIDTFNSVTWQASDIKNQPARLVPLGYYGGTTMTHALLSGSPAINTGNNCVVNQSCTGFNAPFALTTDQRGASRVGNVDIGAFELNNSTNNGSFKASLPDGKQGTAYSFTLVPNNVLNGTTFTYTAGTLPNGLQITTTNNVVALSGAPTVNGTFNFSVTASDGTNTNVTDYTLYIAPGGADLLVTKIDSPDPVIAGSNLTYTIQVANSGPEAAASVALSDTLPAGTSFVSLSAPAGWNCTMPGVGSSGTVTCTAATVANGASEQFTLVVKVDSATAAGTVLSNTATVSSATADPNTGNESATATTTVAAQADLQITKSDGGASVAPGGTVAYILAYSNNGASTAANVVITETIPANTTFNSAASTSGWSCSPNNNAGSTCTLQIGSVNPTAGGSATFAVTVVNPVAAGVSQLSNTASIASTVTDPITSNNSASDTTPVNAQPDLSITKSDGGATTALGGTVAYTLGYSNTGNQGATGVTITETVPQNTSFNSGASTAGWSCAGGAPAGSICTLTIGSLNAGGSGGVTFAVTVSNPLNSAATEVSNTVTIADDAINGTDPMPGNNSASDTTPIILSPTIAKAFSPSAIQPTQNSTVSLTLTNPNSIALTNASFADILSNMTAVGGASGGTCTGASSNVFAAGAANLNF
ncbi:MAG TPA: choice-of-anchor Q domain-containing protein, partial [Pyrinomonadaceae bacterium]